MRKACVSITNNIAEGHGRMYYQENMRFCRMARGSVEEILDDINVCLDLGYGSKSDNEPLKGEGDNLVAKINSDIAYHSLSQQGNK